MDVALPSLLFLWYIRILNGGLVIRSQSAVVIGAEALCNTKYSYKIQ